MSLLLDMPRDNKVFQALQTINIMYGKGIVVSYNQNTMSVVRQSADTFITTKYWQKGNSVFFLRQHHKISQ